MASYPARTKQADCAWSGRSVGRLDVAWMVSWLFDWLLVWLLGGRVLPDSDDLSDLHEAVERGSPEWGSLLEMLLRSLEISQ